MPVRQEEHFIVSEPYLPFTVFINRDMNVSIHWHTYVEILFVITGHALISIGSERFEVTAGDLLIINSQEIHGVQPVDEIFTEILVIQFEPWVLNPGLGTIFECRYIIPFLQGRVKYSKYLKLDDGSGLKSLLIEMLEDFSRKNAGYEFNIKGNIYKIFSWLIRNEIIKIPSGIQLNATEMSRVRNLFEYIEANYQKEITIAGAARIACLSYHHFCRFFKKITGKTFLQYLNFVRVREAEKLILTTDKNISEIALDVGFSSVGGFNKAFKREKSLAPLAYKKAKL